MAKVIVLVSDLDDAKHGEITVLDGHQKAARMVETLLESGFIQDRIRVFTADEMDMKVSHRPVVALVSGDLTGQGPPSQNGSSNEDSEADDRREVKPVTASAKLQQKTEAVTAAPFVKDGVRFSSQFRPA